MCDSPRKSSSLGDEVPIADDTRAKAKQQLKICWAPEAERKDPTVQESQAQEPATGLGSCGSRVCSHYVVDTVFPQTPGLSLSPLTAVSRALLKTLTLFLANSAQFILSRTAC